MPRGLTWEEFEDEQDREVGRRPAGMGGGRPRKLIHSEAVCLDCPTAFGFESDLTREEVEERMESHRAAQSRHRLVAYEGIGHLWDSLEGAKVIEYDPDLDVVFAWFGGHGIHAYDPRGDELNLWNVGDFTKDAATLPEVHRGIARIKRELKEERER
jgi:hypothetical protein